MAHILHRSMISHYPLCLDPQLLTLFIKLSWSPESSSTDLFIFYAHSLKPRQLTFLVPGAKQFCASFVFFCWSGAVLITFCT